MSWLSAQKAACASKLNLKKISIQFVNPSDIFLIKTIEITKLISCQLFGFILEYETKSFSAQRKWELQFLLIVANFVQVNRWPD